MAKRRRVRMDRFNAQVAEHVIGPDSLVELEIGDGQYVTIKLPLMLNEGDTYAEDLERAQAEGGKAVALEVFGHDPDRTAEDQYQAWTDAGLTDRDLAIAFGVELSSARERLGNFRFNG